MEIKRYHSIFFFVKKMRKDLLDIDRNNSTGEFSLLLLQLENSDLSPECKKININKWKKIN